MITDEWSSHDGRKGWFSSMGLKDGVGDDETDDDGNDENDAKIDNESDDAGAM